MASTEETLFSDFEVLSQDQAANISSIADSVSAITSGLKETVHAASSTNSSTVATVDPGDILTGIRQPVNTPPAETSSGSSSSIANNLLSVGSEVLGSGLGLVPLISGLLGIFGGGPAAQPKLQKYEMPEHLSFTGADLGNGIDEGDYDQFGIPRLYDMAPMSTGNTTTAGSGSASGVAANGGSGSGASLPTQINVTVQAMDSQSFLDHSNDIAQAVRQAMLSLNSINDVVNDL